MLVLLATAAGQGKQRSDFPYLHPGDYAAIASNGDDDPKYLDVYFSEIHCVRAYDGDDVVAATRLRTGTRVRIIKTDIVALEHTRVGAEKRLTIYPAQFRLPNGKMFWTAAPYGLGTYIPAKAAVYVSWLAQYLLRRPSDVTSNAILMPHTKLRLERETAANDSQPFFVRVLDGRHSGRTGYVWAVIVGLAGRRNVCAIPQLSTERSAPLTLPCKSTADSRGTR